MMCDIKITDFTAVDAAAAAEIERGCFSDPWSEQSLASEAVCPLTVALAARAAAGLVGYVFLSYDGALGYISNVAVRPDCRRTGIGRELISALLDRACSMGIETITLDVRDTNEAAIALYRSLGFREAGRRRSFYRLPVQDSVIMLYESGVTLRPMRDSDEDHMALLGWLGTPDVMEYYSTAPKDIDDVKEKYGPRIADGRDFFTIIIERGGSPVGYLQYYRADREEYCLGNFPEYFGGATSPWAADILIGTGGVGQGTGTAAMRLLVSLVFDTTDCDVLLIDPNAANKRAIRCYEKAGFARVGIMKEHDLHNGRMTDSLLMALRRPDRRDI